MSQSSGETSGKGVTVFMCNRGSKRPDLKKIQLEVPVDVLEWYKLNAPKWDFTPKAYMEKVLRNFARGEE